MQENSPDLLFGKIAVKKEYLTQSQVSTLLERQRECSGAGDPASLGELAVRNKILTLEQVGEILLAQECTKIRDKDRLLGILAIKNGFATTEEVDLALHEQKQDYQPARGLPKRLGEILVEMGTMTWEQLAALLAAQSRITSKIASQHPSGQSTTVPAGTSPPQADPTLPDAAPHKGCLGVLLLLPAMLGWILTGR